MNFSDIANLLVNSVEGNNSIDSKLATNLIEFSSPYPTSPSNIKRGIFYIVTQGTLVLDLRDGTEKILSKGSIIQVISDTLTSKLAMFNSSFKKTLSENIIHVYVEIGVGCNGSKFESIVLDVTEDSFKESKCTLEQLNDIIIKGKSIGKEFYHSGVIQPLTLLMGDFYHLCECRDKKDIRCKYSLGTDLIVNAACQYLNEDGEWITYDSYQIRPDYLGNYFQDLIDLGHSFEYKDATIQRLHKEIPNEEERSILCEALFKLAKPESLKYGGRCVQEVAEHILDTVGYCSVTKMVELAKEGKLTKEALEELHGRSHVYA